jgi:hypothetical protein
MYSCGSTVEPQGRKGALQASGDRTARTPHRVTAYGDSFLVLKARLSRCDRMPS